MVKVNTNVLTIGNAIVDTLFRVDESLINTSGLTKGTMSLVSAEEASGLRNNMGPGFEVCGGSAANTAVGIAVLGGKASFIGKVGDDKLGQVFEESIVNVGVNYKRNLSITGAPTANCVIFVTEDGERTMNTYLGACTEISPEDIDPALVTNSSVTYLEGYLWDPADAKAAFQKVFNLTRESQKLSSLSLSDVFCVNRHRNEFRELVKNNVDILFANEEEIIALYEASDFTQAVSYIQQDCSIAALTRGSQGSLVVTADKVHIIESSLVKDVVDTTGAGDMFAAGFLYGLIAGFELDRCGRLGSLVAEETISYFGARPETDLIHHISNSA